VSKTRGDDLEHAPDDHRDHPRRELRRPVRGSEGSLEDSLELVDRVFKTL